MSGPGWAAAALCALNFVGAWFLLPESLQENSEHAKQRPHLDQWLHTLRHPQIGLLITVFFLSTLCFTSFELTIGLLVSQNFSLNFKDGHDAKTITWLFAYCGIIGVLVQGSVGRLVKSMGEKGLIVLSSLLVAVSLGPMAFIHSWGMMYFALALLSIGSNLTRAPVFGLVSILSPQNEQGATIGVAQSAGSLARMIGPVFAGTLFDFHPSWPYVASGALALATGLLALRLVVPPHQPVTVAE
jgi:predicted MFS family arabinose efflux permease